MKKNLILTLSFISIISILFGIFSFNTRATDSIFNSKGIIRFNQGEQEVVFDASDLDTINNNITTGKNQIKQALNVYTDTNITDEIPSFQTLSDVAKNITRIPIDTYFYDDTTGLTDLSTLKRYKKVEDEFFECNSRGVITSDTPTVIDESNLIEYTSMSDNKLSLGTAGYVNKHIELGNGYDVKNSNKELTVVKIFDGGISNASNNPAVFDLSIYPNYENFAVGRNIFYLVSSWGHYRNNYDYGGGSANLYTLYDVNTGSLKIYTSNPTSSSNGMQWGVLYTSVYLVY